jgi:hypothetical protein
MTPTLGFSYGRFIFQKRSVLQSDLDLKFNLKILKIILNQLSLFPPKWACDITPAKLVFKMVGC